MSDTESDKYFWHRYIDTYEEAFKKLGAVDSILEFGILRGASIRWLAKRFPHAQIVGLDILPVSAEWPVSERITYRQVDQSDRAAVARTLADLGRHYDLVIEDGSHIPQHQAICLTETLPWVRSGGLYILEDIHSSHREHQLFKRFQPGDLAQSPNALNVLLALQHAIDRRLPVDDLFISKVISPTFFTREHIIGLQRQIAGTYLFKRTQLPLACWNCRGHDYDYAGLRCRCGHSLYENAESMSCLITKA